MLFLAIISVVSLCVAGHTLIALCRLGKLHNELGAMHDTLVAEFHAFKSESGE